MPPPPHLVLLLLPPSPPPPLLIAAACSFFSSSSIYHERRSRNVGNRSELSADLAPSSFSCLCMGGGGSVFFSLLPSSPHRRRNMRLYKKNLPLPLSLSPIFFGLLPFLNIKKNLLIPSRFFNFAHDSTTTSFFSSLSYIRRNSTLRDVWMIWWWSLAAPSTLSWIWRL